MGGCLPRAEPEENDRMELVNVWDAEGRKHQEENYMAQNKVGSKVAKFSNLTEELATRLRHRVPTHVVPLSCPPSDIGLVMLEFSGQCERDDQFVDKSLNGSHGNHSKNTARPIEGFQKEHDLEDREKHYYSNTMGDSSEHGSEFFAAHA